MTFVLKMTPLRYLEEDSTFLMDSPSRETEVSMKYDQGRQSFNLSRRKRDTQELPALVEGLTPEHSCCSFTAPADELYLNGQFLHSLLLSQKCHTKQGPSLYRADLNALKCP